MHRFKYKTQVAADALCRSAGLAGADIQAKLDSGFNDEHELVQSKLRTQAHNHYHLCVHTCRRLIDLCLPAGRTMRSDARHAFDSGKMPHSFRLPKSRYQIIIPDRFGLLKEDEVLLKVPGLECLLRNVYIESLSHFSRNYGSKFPRMFPGQVL